MTKQQLFGFLKAPFSRSFITSYMLTLVSLLCLPLLARTIDFYREIDVPAFLAAPRELEASLLSDFFLTEPMLVCMGMAIIGIILFCLITQSYTLCLTHRTVVANGPILDAQPMVVRAWKVLKTIPKMFLYGLACILPIVPAILVLCLGQFVSILSGMVGGFVVGIALWIAIICLFAYLLFKGLCYLMAYNVMFYREFRVGLIFERARIKAYFSEHKGKLFLSWLLFWIAGQILNTLYSSITKNIFFGVVDGAQWLKSVQQSSFVAVLVGMLVWNLIFLYLTSLYAIIFGKIILWIEGPKEDVAQQLPPSLPSVETPQA